MLGLAVTPCSRQSYLLSIQYIYIFTRHNLRPDRVSGRPDGVERSLHHPPLLPVAGGRQLPGLLQHHVGVVVQRQAQSGLPARGTLRPRHSQQK